MSEPSPYREAGISAMDVTSENRRAHRDPRLNKVLVGNSRAPYLGHDFGPGQFARGRKPTASYAPICRNCHQPKFVIEHKKCRGKK